LDALLLGVVTPDAAGFGLIVTGLTMVIVGGLNSWIGAVIGAILVQWLPLELQSLANWWDVVNGGLIILVAVYAQGGIYGSLQAVGRFVAQRIPVRARPAAPRGQMP
jgi:branched-chain amino acid transport system permease protein